MIQTIANLLEEIKQKELQVLAKYGHVKHGPMIGNMYEGLTRDLVNRAIFDGLDLRVVSGMIIDNEGRKSHQIDCMIVVGDGDRLPYSNDYLYDIDQVIAVIEVKKNLYAAEVRDAYENLVSVCKLNARTSFIPNLFLDAYRTVVSVEPPEFNELDKVSPLLRQMYYYLFQSASMPVKIVFGYHGFASEYALREKFVKFIETGVGEEKPALLGPLHLPDLIICRESSLVKLNGMPYVMQASGGDPEEIPLYASNGRTPIVILLELIWTKLAYKYKLNHEIFGEDLNGEFLSPLLWMKQATIDGKSGWMYRYHRISKEKLLAAPATLDWEPYFFDEHVYVIFLRMAATGEVDTQDPELKSFLEKRGFTVDEVVATIIESRLAFLHEGRFLRLLTEELVTVFMPDGTTVLADDKTGRLTRWVFRG